MLPGVRSVFIGLIFRTAVQHSIVFGPKICHITGLEPRLMAWAGILRAVPSSPGFSYSRLSPM